MILEPAILVATGGIKTLISHMIVRIPLRLSNAYLLKGQQPVLIDTGCPGEEKNIIRALDAHRYSLRDLRLIIHTHAHMDHAGSTAALTTLAGIPSLIHSRDYDQLLQGTNGTVQYHSFAGWFIYQFLLRNYPGAKADITFEKMIDLQDFGIEGKLVHTPGHTAGSCSVVMSNGEAVVGDLFIGGWLGGWIDPNWPTYHFFTEDKELVNRSIRKLLDMGVEKFHTGHGGPINRKEVEQFLQKTARKDAKAE